MAYNILLIDDEQAYIDTLLLILGTLHVTIETATDPNAGLALASEQSFDLIISDYKMPGLDGFDIIKRLKAHSESTDIIIITGYGDVQNAVEAIKLGASAYFIKGQDPHALTVEVNKLIKQKSIREARANQPNGFCLTSQNSVFKRALDLATRAASANASILLTGESGVGKEVIANYIHQLSGRENGKFIAVNCHAIADNLLESELFGHEKGAFTGASQTRIGRIESAHGGTLFLDEIGDTSPDIQLKLLRVLDNKTIERLGSNQSIAVDYRLISATNKELKDSIQNNGFRQDFYYRISTITIELPPLRQRREDLPMLIDHFINRFARDMKKHIAGISPNVHEQLLHYDYPGNIRELKNIIERLVVLASGDIIEAFSFPLEMPLVGEDDSLRAARAKAERSHIINMLKKCDGNLTLTAKHLAISRRQLFNKIKQYQIN